MIHVRGGGPPLVTTMAREHDDAAPRGGLMTAAERAVRALLRVLVHVLWRLEVRGAEHFPARGGALVVANHLSYADPFLVGAAARRPMRYWMYRAFFAHRLVGGFARLMGSVPVAPEDSRAALRDAIERTAARLRAGELVCVFPEGSISRTGSLLPFARGIELTARRAGAPIVPVAIDGIWGSALSYSGGRAPGRRSGRPRRRVRVEVGAPLPPDTPAWAVRDAVARLAAEARGRGAGARDTLTDRFLRAAARHARRPALVDSTGRRLSYRQLLRAALALRGPLRRAAPGEVRVGVCLPPGAGGALANLALALDGREVVNLNYSLGAEAMRETAERAGLAHVVSSPRFVEALGGEAPGGAARALALEDLAEGLRPLEKLSALVLSVLPGPLLARLVRPVRDPGRTATVLFSSGSTGTPKGVVLSHANVLANVRAFREVLGLDAGERLLGILPFFHAFGYTATLWAPLLAGATAVYHARPTDGARIAELVARERVGIAIGTPTFFQAWLRRAAPESWGGVRLCFAGAEPLRPALARAWRERTGVELLEGYGATELSPVVSVNLPDVEAGGVRQVNRRAGTVGRPLPGVAVRVVDPDTGAAQPPEVEGELWVAGPGVMQGYLDDPARTAEVLHDGWYDTGDRGHVDRDGFLVLTGRRSRFSKIGGEMVPHGRVEELLSTLAAELASGGPPVELAVTGVADPRRGERLVVLHTPLPFERQRLLDALAESDLPPLFRPRPDAFFEVPALPVLGTGKLDLGALQAEAEARAAAAAPAGA